MKKTEKDTELITSERARRAGLKRIPRRHISKPGEVKLSDCKVRITMYLDADILEYFKMRAEQPNAAPYQTQINNELRAVIEGNLGKADMDAREALATLSKFIEENEARV